MDFVKKTDWSDEPSVATPISAAELLRMENGIEEGARDATESAPGNVELATSGEMAAGTSLTRVPSVKRVADHVANKADITHTHTSEINTAVSDHLTDDPHLGSHDDSSHTSPSRTSVKLSGTTIGARPTINLIPGTDVDLDVIDNAGTNAVDVTVNAASGLTPPTALDFKTVSFVGALAAGSSQFIPFSQPTVLKSIRLVAKVEGSTPTTVDIHKVATVADASIFSDQGLRPVLPIGQKWASTWARNISIAAGEFLRVDIDTAGTGVEDLAVILEYEVSATSFLEILTNTGGGNGIVDGDTVTTANSGGTDNAFNTVSGAASGGTTIKYENTDPVAGQSFTQEIVHPGGTAQCYCAWTFTDTPELYFRMKLRMPTDPGGATCRILTILDNGASKITVGITTAGLLQILNASATQIAATTTAVNNAAWFRIEGRVVGGANGFIQLWLFNTHDSATVTEEELATSSDIGASYDEIRFGRVGAQGSMTALTWKQAQMAASTLGKVGP